MQLTTSKISYKSALVYMYVLVYTDNLCYIWHVLGGIHNTVCIAWQRYCIHPADFFQHWIFNLRWNYLLVLLPRLCKFFYQQQIKTRVLHNSWFQNPKEFVEIPPPFDYLWAYFILFSTVVSTNTGVQVARKEISFPLELEKFLVSCF